MNEQLRFRALKLATQNLLGEFDNLRSAALFCRADATRLSQYQNFEYTATMPIDIVLALELACGKPHITRAMTEFESAEFAETGCVVSEAMDVGAASGRLMEEVRNAVKPDSPGGIGIAESESRKLFKKMDELAAEVRDLQVAVQANTICAEAAE